MLDWLLDILKVVPNYNFIVTVIAAGMTIHWAEAELGQWRLEGIIQRLWDRRDREIRFKKTQKGEAQ